MATRSELPGSGSSPLTRGKRRSADADALRAPAHPRSRGENASVPSSSLGMTGSSPLTRGKQDPYYDALDATRLIPAHAGKTPVCAKDPRLRAAHPRSRGENASGSERVSRLGGSSPLTRGKRRQRTGQLYCPWLIPAHAGKTPRLVTSRRPWPAHPRSRGENIRAVSTTPHLSGSSPLTRGKPAAGEDRRRRPGLIPAHAGKTARGRQSYRRAAAHPRSRGENPSTGKLIGLATGSSPLTRGKRDRRQRQRQTNRLIPAHAGKTSFVAAVGSVMPAHPRSRGENKSLVGKSI